MKAMTLSAVEGMETLKCQTISATTPGSVLLDADLLLRFVGTAGIKTGSKRGNLPQALLAELNARMTRPLELNLKRPLLRDYPNIAGVYILLRVMDLIVVEGSWIRLAEDRFELWNQLNDVEKYFALMEVWLIDADPEVLGGEQRYFNFQHQFAGNLVFLTQNISSKNWTSFSEYVHISDPLYRGISTWNAHLQEQLGLIEMQARSGEDRKATTAGWMLWKAKRTPWGEAAAWTILKAVGLIDKDRIFFYHLPKDADFGFLRPAFEPYFPEWKTNYSSGALRYKPGLYRFKVHIRNQPDVWRIFAAPDEVSLDDLAYVILEAFEFGDTEHLYEFSFRDNRGARRHYYHPECDEGPYGHEIFLGETGLQPKQNLEFLFDYGARWDFTLKLESVEAMESEDQTIKVLKAHGKAPDQY